MSDVPLNEAFFQKTAGWEAVQHARLLLASGKVLSSNWTPPLLKGVVQAGDTSYRAGLVIKSHLDIENLCTCRQSREAGTICPHSVAVGLHHLQGASPVRTAASGPAPGRSTASASSPGPSRPSAAPPGPSPSTRPGARLRREPAGVPLEIAVLFPPNLADTLARGRITLVFEGITGRQRAPLNSLVKGGPYRLEEADLRLLDAAEAAAGGDTPGMVQLPLPEFVTLLPALAGHPRLSLGRQQRFEVDPQPASVPLRARLETDGTITLGLANTRPPAGLVRDGDRIWILETGRLRRFPLPGAFAGVLEAPLRIPRIQVPLFLAHGWPQLAALGTVDSNFAPGDFTLTPQPPRFLLQLSGGLAQLAGTLQCAYGPRVMTVGVTARDDGAWIPDPADPRRYSARDLSAEQQALQRLRQAGFSGPNAQGQIQLAGQERVLAFFAREYPRLEKEWSVTLEERLDRTTRNTFERVTPELRVTSSGQQWFDLEVGYSSEGGERLSAADIQQLLRGGGRRLRNGRIALIDTGAVEEIQQVLVDCAPSQSGAGDHVRYRLGASQAGYLQSSLRGQGLELQAPAAWSDRSRRQQGEVALECPPLGDLEPVLRPYQRQGVAWLRFLREEGFGGILADEMGLGKTLQVLAHLAAARLKTRPDAPPPAPSLVICPSSLVFNWAAEAARWTPGLRVLALDGTQRHRHFDRIPQSDLVITSYALIRRDLDRYRGIELDTVILDEAQHIKNRATRNAQAVKSLRSAHRLVLTGTPLENSVLDLWSIFDFLMPGYLGTADDFRERYEVAITRERDQATMARLGRRVRPFLLRRLKRDVVRELPPKLEQVSYCELTEEQAAVYQQLLGATRKKVEEAVGGQGLARSRMLVLTALLRLRQVCCDLRLLGLEPAATGEPDDLAPGTQAEAKAAPSGKVQMFGELLDEVVDGGHRVLVFSQFTSMLGLLREELEARELPFCYLDGSTTDRGAVVEKFQKNESIPVFLISLKAGGVGLNLTGADTVIHFDPWWNPAVEDQATDRAHRIGQTRVVTSYKLITRGTVEEKILNLQQKKRELIAATLTGEEVLTQSLTWEEIQDLLA